MCRLSIKSTYRIAAIRTGIDMLIGTWFFLNGAALLHFDRGYDPLERHLGLKTVASPRLTSHHVPVLTPQAGSST